MRRRLLFLLSATLLSTALPSQAQLTAADVARIVDQATRRANRIAPNSVIAVTDREGYVLAVWVPRGGEPTALEVATSVGKAGTAAFLSSNSNAFTSRTAGFIIQPHFPPGVFNLPPGPLVGVGFSNLPFSDVNRFKKADFIPGSPSPGTFGSPIPLTSLNGIPGGLPLYKNNVCVGGIGVTGTGIEFPPTAFVGGYSRDEDIALVGQIGFAPRIEIWARDVFINGISLPYVESTPGSIAGSAFTGNAAAMYPIIAAPPPFPYPTATFAGVPGQIRQPIMSDPLPGTINGQPRLSAAEVTAIIIAAADRVRTTRAGIRLPVGQQMEAFISVVNNPNMPGVAPTVLGTFRTGDATIFSWDVAVQKARTAVAFSSRTLAFSTRTVGFLAQIDYPPGIDPESPGPFYGLQEEVSGFDRNALPELVPTAALLSDPPFAPNVIFPNGITIFPGGFPLYRNGELIGAIGISGDGVDQDDIVGASGTINFPAPEAIRADQFSFGGTRLPYAKFPRDPEGGPNIVPAVMPVFAALMTDFNADWKTDLVWQNNVTGERALWLMNGTTCMAMPWLPTVGLDWQIASTADFDRNGRADLLWQNRATGQRAIWLMNGTQWIGERFLPTIPVEWEIAGTGDFSGDGHTDIVWQNRATGQRAIWLMHESAMVGEHFLPTIMPSWEIVGTDDFNADGHIDLVWQNTDTGQRSIWFMNRLTMAGERWLPTIPTSWKIAGTGDMNGDHTPDLIWQEASGRRAVWFMQDGNMTGEHWLPTIDSAWEIRNH